MSFKPLPLVEYIGTFYGEVDLSKALIIGVQHILLSNLVYFRQLIDRGLIPENIFILGKAYSTSQEVLDQWKSLGCYVSDLSTTFDSHEAFDKQFDKFVTLFLKHTEFSKDFSDYEKIILVDDGGHLIEQANERWKGFADKICAVEQTSGGFRKLTNLSLNLPVINVARSTAKLNFESPYIARAVVEDTQKYLKENKIEVQRVLLMGAGYIGREVKNQFGKETEVIEYDELKELTSIEKEELSDFIERADLIIGTTGSRSLPKDYHAHLRGNTVLVSVSSSDREFDAVEIRRKHPQNSDPHKNYIEGGLHLVNSGFPINFDGAPQRIPLKEIQITMALLFSAILEGVANTYQPGFVELSSDVQSRLIEEFRKQVP